MPKLTGDYVVKHCEDERVVVVTHEQNQGVGGAVMTGYRLAVLAGAEVIVKLDGDGQMDPALIPQFVLPIAEQRADYVKGNRFYNIEDVRVMPRRRLIGNAVLSFVTKLSSGYWTTFDPTNGYTAISAKLLPFLPLGRIHSRYFFESDMLFRLGTISAVIVDIPMTAIYGDEQSGLHVRQVLLPFIWGNFANMGKRVFYNYFLRGFSIASVELLAGIGLMLFGILFGTWNWAASVRTGLPATTGTVMLAALPVILGVQLLLQFLAFDIGSVPTRSIAPFLPWRPIRTEGAAVIRSEFRCGQPGLVETADGKVAPDNDSDPHR